MAAAGKDVPALRSRPSLTGYRGLWDAFIELSTCRTMGMSAGPIPWTAVQQYAFVERLDAEETRTLHDVIRHMDGILAEHQNKSAVQARGGAPRKPHKPRKPSTRGRR